MTTFKDNLLNDLMCEHGQTVEVAPERHRRSARPLLAAAGVLAMAGAATIAIVNSDSPAYAVTKNADGSVTVSIRDIKGVDGANAKLHEYGIGAKAVPMSRDCAELDETKMDLLGDYVLPRVADDGSITMSPGDIPAGYTVLLGISNMPNRDTGLGFTGPIRNPAPDCLAEVGN
ncbi:hypothetical protein [Lentzea albidocapillata]|uniref:Uncharacterized protein n=1 Tax=Lentzea albidocapillata TaxID=40571 RepID=A0A1W2E3Q0_9PSEU|nr:hypothetical protein [Lentzea albidocapillata]SMD04379.1 hypothetical protein SAMN05660733_03670 [Lentzea albidocapillata]